MRVAPLLLVLLALGPSASAQSTDIGSSRAAIVRGDAVPLGAGLGTVALLRAAEGDEALDDVNDINRASIPNRITCSGTLITPTTVLTAGHCVQACADEQCNCADTGCAPVPSRFIHVGAGLADIDSVWSAEITRVSDIVLQEDYTEWGSLDFVRSCDARRCPGFAPNANDLALLILEEPVTAVRPIPVYPESRIDELAGTTVGLAHGYGRALAPDSEALLPQDSFGSLLRGGLSPIAQTTEQELLTARGEENVAVCYGDSGGPLYVTEGDTTWVVGVATRLRGDARECFGGGMYALAPAYTDWIGANATGNLVSAETSGRGCSASGAPRDAAAMGLLALLLLVLLRRGRHVGPAVAVTLSVGIGCGGSDAVDYCSPERDVLGTACSRDGLSTSLEAEAAARSEVPDDAWLLGMSGRAVGPDGVASQWFFSYYLPGRRELPQAELVTVTVSREASVGEPFVADLSCIPTRPLTSLDSRTVVADGIRALEESGYMVVFDGNGLLDLQHAHLCGVPSLSRSVLEFEQQQVLLDETGTPLNVVLTD